MLPEPWQKVQRLLLICAFDDSDLVLQIAPALKVLCQTLPDTEMRFLMVRGNQYDFLACGSQSPQKSTELFSISVDDRTQLIGKLQEFAFDAAIIFTTPAQSPYSFAYLCYLANIPIRLGQSLEFGGGVLSPWVKPPTASMSLADYHLHLLQSTGLAISSQPEAILSLSSPRTV